MRTPAKRHDGISLNNCLDFLSGSKSTQYISHSYLGRIKKKNVVAFHIFKGGDGGGVGNCSHVELKTKR